MSEPILQIEGLKTWFHTDDGIAKAVDDGSMTIEPGPPLTVPPPAADPFEAPPSPAGPCSRRRAARRSAELSFAGLASATPLLPLPEALSGAVQLVAQSAVQRPKHVNTH